VWYAIIRQIRRRGLTGVCKCVYGTDIGLEKKKQLMKFVFIRPMQELVITVGVNLHFPWKLGNIIGLLYFLPKVV